ncbi:helix-turn-helix domain-containing protein [Herbaspirillum lusitanum]|uniref:Helix-turn-helix domain-containing protein n=1 Tax=Herbaspirillum lusitanum TaxID=213312 RepID=A0ABW9A9X4_9BURK
MNTLAIAQLITTRRRQLGLTQAELANRAQIGRRTLIELEGGSGANDIGYRKLERILNAVGLSITITDTPKRPTESELSALFAEDEDDDEA